MNYSKLVFALLLISISFLVVTSCDDSKTNQAIGEMALTEKVEKDGLKVAEEVKGVIDELPENINAKKTESIYTLSEVDEAPFFGQKCKKLGDSSECNKRNIVSFIRENIELPKQAESSNYSGLEYVKVTITENGTMSDLKYVSTKNTTCSWCQQTAVDVVGKMQSWEPALKNGKPVPVEITIPIKFLS